MELLSRCKEKKDAALTKVREHEHFISFIKHLKIGMRIIKTVVAVFICCMIDYFRGTVPFQSTMAAIICIQPDTENTVNMAISRVLATLLGSISATLLLFAFANTSIAVPSVTFYVVMSLVLIPLISITVKMGWPSASALTCIIFLTICIGYHGEDDLFITALHRMIDTLVGIFVALPINAIFPNRALPAEGGAEDAENKAGEAGESCEEQTDAGQPESIESQPDEYQAGSSQPESSENQSGEGQTDLIPDQPDENKENKA